MNTIFNRRFITTKNLRNGASAFIGLTALLAAGCQGSPSVVAAPYDPQPIVAQPQVYEFVEHGPAPRIERTIQTEASCVTTCLDDWRINFAHCTADLALDDTRCRAQAHEAASVCLEIVCPSEATRVDDTCAASCDAEAREVGRECINQHGYDGSCLQEADAVYLTCHDAECRPPLGPNAKDVVSTGSILEHFLDPANTPEDIAEPLTCGEMCEAYDMAVYIKCVNDGDVPASVCRDRVGAAEHVCLAQHCPADPAGDDSI